ncbi:hypothetical protein AMECASPLE_004283 [Ameca splendens]|uniref:Uncharacterized protein n=1 Tax=Ameca splendens TaxID=208324 RepID=A0ABV0ZV18_9TELE
MSMRLRLVLLSLGASPDYKDRRGLTPLYHTVLTGGDTSCCETLLYHHAKLGIRDENGWDETHQAESELKGLPKWELAASGAPALLWGGFLLPERFWKHCLAHLCFIQQGKLCTNPAVPWSKQRHEKQQRTDSVSGGRDVRPF